MSDYTKIDLSQYRLQKAKEMLASARRDMDAKDFASANNRVYYAIFHAMRAVLATSLIRNRSDYEDFYICSVADTQALFSGAIIFCADVDEYLKKQYGQNSD